VAAVVAGQSQNGQIAAPLPEALERAFHAATGRALGNVAELIPELTAERIVRSRVGVGGCAPAPVGEMIASVRQSCTEFLGACDAAEAASTFPALLRQVVSERLGKKG
jgi:hypothetical protein